VSSEGLWPRVLIAGGSIGGLTTALVLSELGCDVDIFERSGAALEGRGAGIVVLPTTERYFVEKGIPRVSLELPWWKYVDRSGRELSADLDRFRFSGWNTLYRGLLGELDSDRYHLDSEMVDFHQDGKRVVLRLGDGTQVEGDMLVCADGFGSTARGMLLPEVGPQYAGYVAWRGVADESSLPASTRAALVDSMLYQVLEDGHILVYAIPNHDGSTSPGRRLINFVWYRNYPAGPSFARVMTDTRGELRSSTVPPGAVRSDHLEELHRTADEVLAPVLADVVHRADEILIQAIFDLECPRMTFGRVCLIGDAAFVARPHLAAGQAKACADAWALADALADHEGDVIGSLVAWEPDRLALGREVVRRSREMGRRSQTGRMRVGDPEWKFGLGAVKA
jgi:2,6-dihydroxypyridine 3-monooxygenase